MSKKGFIYFLANMLLSECNNFELFSILGMDLLCKVFGQMSRKGSTLGLEDNFLKINTFELVQCAWKRDQPGSLCIHHLEFHGR